MTLAERYKDREGGYTRILRYGRRAGDKAEMAVVCLVDGPRDMRFEMMARQVGRQAVEDGHLGEGEVLQGGVQQWERKLRDKTKKALKQVLKMRSEDDKREFETKAKLWAVSVSVALCWRSCSGADSVGPSRGPGHCGQRFQPAKPRGQRNEL